MPAQISTITVANYTDLRARVISYSDMARAHRQYPSVARLRGYLDQADEALSEAHKRGAGDPYGELAHAARLARIEWAAEALHVLRNECEPWATLNDDNRQLSRSGNL